MRVSLPEGTSTLALAEAARKACAGLRIVVHLDPAPRGDHQTNGAAEAMAEVLRAKANLLVQQIEEATGCDKPVFWMSSPSLCLGTCSHRMVAQSFRCATRDDQL